MVFIFVSKCFICFMLREGGARAVSVQMHFPTLRVNTFGWLFTIQKDFTEPKPTAFKVFRIQCLSVTNFIGTYAIYLIK